MTRGIIEGAAVGAAILSGGIMTAAWLIYRGKTEPEKIGYMLLISLIISSFMGARYACFRIKRRRLLSALMTGAAFLMIIAGISALLFGPVLDGVGVTAVLVMGGSGAAAMLNGSLVTHRKKGRTAGVKL